MTFEELIKVALAAPPGSIMHATAKPDNKGNRSDFEVVAVNGQKPKEA
jgi:hypothetical protein